MLQANPKDLRKSPLTLVLFLLLKLILPPDPIDRNTKTMIANAKTKQNEIDKSAGAGSAPGAQPLS